MEFTYKARRYKVEYQTIIIAATILAWAVYYYCDTVTTPYGGAESVMFIKPLVILLALIFPLVVRSAVSVVGESADKPAGQAAGPGKAKDVGFFDKRRIVFASSLVGYAVTLTLFGYLVPTVLFVIFVSFFLGERDWRVFIGVPVLGIALLAAVFTRIVGVPLPLWPWS